MRSLISKYSIEGRGDDGAPNGQFYLRRGDVENVSNEVVGTHFGFKGEKRQKFINERLPKIWNHFDVNNQGYLTVERVPVLLKMLVGENEMNNQL